MKYFWMLEYLVCKALKKLRPRAIRGSSVHKGSSIGPGSEFLSSEMDRNSYLGVSCRVVDTKIGSFCSIANDCCIGLDTHSIDWVSTSPVFNKNREQIKTKYSKHEFKTRTVVSIGNDVWIGEKVVIKSGVTIGTGAIIGAGSVVTKDVPPYEIWGGVPAKCIRQRFPAELAEGLLKSRWWELSDEELTRVAPFVKDPAVFLRKLNE